MQNHDYQLPTVEMLTQGTADFGEDKGELRSRRAIINQTLRDFDIPGEVTGTVSGPRVTRFEIAIEPGANVRKVERIAANIAMNLAAPGVRVLAPIPGSPAVGVEVANTGDEVVFMRTVMESEAWKNTKAHIPVVVGADIGGKPVVIDLAKAPHMLISGATGTGKSVAMNTLIASLLFKFRPDELKFVLIDPKIIEFEQYGNLPHLLVPVVNDLDRVPTALRRLADEVDRRYAFLAQHHAKGIRDFNAKADGREPLPYLVVVINELADLMMSNAKRDIENSIVRIAQKGRAAGIHIVVSTQRPSTRIITGVIKANLPTRFCFQVRSCVDSRVVLDQAGAEQLLGRGDMLMMHPANMAPERIQGAYEDIANVVDFVCSQAKPEFDPALLGSSAAPESKSEAEALPKAFFDAAAKFVRDGDDELLRQAIAVAVLERKSGADFLRRRLKIGGDRAEKLAEMMRKLFMPSGDAGDTETK